MRETKYHHTRTVDRSKEKRVNTQIRTQRILTRYSIINKDLFIPHQKGEREMRRKRVK